MVNKKESFSEKKRYRYMLRRLGDKLVFNMINELR